MSEQLVICNLSHWGAISVAGQDAAKFLQGQTTCDVTAVSRAQGTIGGLCDYKGRLYAIFYLFVWQDCFYLWMPREIITHTLAQLNKYAVFSKVTVQDRSDELMSIGVCGQDAFKQVTSLLNLEISNNHNSENIPLNKTSYNNAENSTSYVITATPNYLLMQLASQPTRILICGQRGEMQKLQANLLTHFSESSENHWQLLDIQDGLPMISSPIIGEFTPHQLNLPAINGVSFTKGCYTGQEIIARMHYLGKLKQHMYRAQITCEHAPQAGEKVYTKGNKDDFVDAVNNDNNKNTAKEVGTIVSSAEGRSNNTATLNTFELLVVLQDHALTQPALFLGNNDILNILSLPYSWN